MAGPQRSSRVSRKRLLVVSGVATVAFNVALTILDQRLKQTCGPSILGLEFAGSDTRVAEIMCQWGEHGDYLARLSLWIDFGFMLSYGTFFALAALATRDFARARGLDVLASVGVAAPALAIGAALFDLVENVIWLLVLGGHVGAVAPPIATTCAALKFLLIGLAILYALAGAGFWFLSGRKYSG